MGDWIKTLRRLRSNDTRTLTWVDVDITQRSILDAMRDEPSLKDAEAIRWIRNGKCIGTTLRRCPRSETYDGDDVDALLERITELESELATLRKDAAIGAAWRRLGEYGPFLIESAIDAIDNGCGFEDDARDRVRTFRDVSNAAAHAQEIVGNEKSEEVCDG